VAGAAEADAAAEAEAAGVALCVVAFADPDAAVGAAAEEPPALTPTEPVAPAFWAEAPPVTDTNTIDASTANAAFRSLITEPSRQ
jgi:hypothetical protein